VGAGAGGAGRDFCRFSLIRHYNKRHHKITRDRTGSHEIAFLHKPYAYDCQEF
jgi:hypothetical protein